MKSKHLNITQKGEKLIGNYKFLGDTIYEKIYNITFWILASLGIVIIMICTLGINGLLIDFADKRNLPIFDGFIIPPLIESIFASIFGLGAFMIMKSTKGIATTISRFLLIPFSNIINQITNIIKEIVLLTQKDIYSIQTTDGILSKIQTSKSALSVLNLIGFLGVFSKEVKEIQNDNIQEYRDWLIDIIIDLRSDLQLRLEEQQKTLEQAKSEVEANIHGTTELEQVSELQRARLDRQIEQFEELQRVLQKV